jgi:lipopolysaccharide export system permease protein
MSDLLNEKNKRRAKIKELTFSQLMRLRDAEMDKEAENGGGISKMRMKIQMHTQKNFAMAFSVFSLAIFGVPLAIRVGRKESYANLAIALVIALTYYFLIIAVSWFEGNLSLRPDLLIWIPNIIFQVFGFIMIRNAGRH